MLTFFTLFFILFSLWLVLFLFNSMFTLWIVIFGFIITILIAVLVLKLKLFNFRNEFIFLQFGFYKMLMEKLTVSFGENLYLAFQFLLPVNNIDPVVDFLFNENDNIYENNLTCNIFNLSFGVISCLIKNQCFFVHSMSSVFFSPNQLYFLNIETQKINDDSLV